MIHRRDFLQAAAAGTSSLALLPFLNQMQARAAGKADAFPKRFVFVMRSNGLYPTMVAPQEVELARAPKDFDGRGSGKNAGLKDDDTFIEKSLAELTLPEPISALEPYKAQMNVVMGLSGRMCYVNHGARYGALGAYRSQKGKAPTASTVDGVLAQAFPGVFAHVGLAGGGKNSGTSDGLSAVGPKRAVGYYHSPLEAYNNLFSIIADDPSVRKQAGVRGDVLDFMAGDVSRFRKSLPGHERAKLDEYVSAFEAMRDRHQSLLAQRDRLSRLAPEVDKRYGSDDMELRMAAHWDLAASALITGLTNVVAYRLDSGFSGESFSGTLSGLTENCHGIGHQADPTNDNKMLAWQTQNLVKFIKKLSAVKEGDGTMMDNTLIVFFSHYSDAHHSGGYEFPMLTIGNLGGSNPKLRTGRFVNYPYYTHAGNRTIGSMYNTILHAAGIGQETFGELDVNMPEQDQRGPLPELIA